MTPSDLLTGWRKPSRSEPDGNCVEIATTADRTTIGVRDSKNPGPVLTFHRDDWQALLERARRGELDSLTGRCRLADNRAQPCPPTTFRDLVVGWLRCGVSRGLVT